MGATQAILSGVMTIFFYAIVTAGLWKLFQAANELTEIKKLLTDIRQNLASPVARPVPAAFAQPVAPPPPPPSGPISLESAEALLRQVAAESDALDRSRIPG